MSDIDLLLDNEMGNDKVTLTINPLTREIEFDGELMLGVEDDFKAQTIYFTAPTVVGNGIDISEDTVEIWIDYKNALSEPYITDVTGSKTLSEDGKTVTFAWELSGNVSAKKGTVKFRACFKNIDASGKLLNEWHTTNAQGVILEGIDVSQKTTPEVITDKTVTTNNLLKEVAGMRAELADYTGPKQSEIDAEFIAVNTKVDTLSETVDSIGTDLEQLSANFSEHKTNTDDKLAEIDTTLNGIPSIYYKKMEKIDTVNTFTSATQISNLYEYSIICVNIDYTLMIGGSMYYHTTTDFINLFGNNTRASKRICLPATNGNYIDIFIESNETIEYPNDAIVSFASGYMGTTSTVSFTSMDIYGIK